MSKRVPLAIGLLLLTAACGGDDSKQAKTPSGVTKPAPTGEQAGGTEIPKVVSGLEGSAKDAYAKGWGAWLAGDLPGAKVAFADAAQKDAKSPAPHYALGIVNERLGDRTAALQEMRTAYTLKDDFEVAICSYGLMLARQGSKAEADGFLTERHAKAPESARITTCLGELKSIAGDSASAQQLAQSALKIDPDLKDAMVTIARDHYRAHRMDLAKYALQAILDGFGGSSPPRDAGNAEALLVRGLIHREQGARLQAMTDFEAALKKRPDMSEALIQAGSMKLEAGNAQEAFPLLDKAVRFDPKNAIAHLNLGDAYRLQGKSGDAKAEFDQALALDSTLSIVHYDLGLLYLFTPNFPGATPDSQISMAIKELEAYKSMRGPKPPAGGDDVDELLQRAKQKQLEMKNASGAAAPADAAKAPAKDSKPPAKK